VLAVARRGAIRVNPFSADVVGVAQAMLTEEKRFRHCKNYNYLTMHDVVTSVVARV
jgi:hypothetical protein